MMDTTSELPTTNAEPTPAMQSNDKVLSKTTGSNSKEFTDTLLRQSFYSMWLTHADEDDKKTLIQGMGAALRGIAPQDELEGMLAAQMVATHNAAMECFRRAMLSEQTFEGRNMSLNHANKLTRAYAALVEALNKYRGKGQQKMTVEHVHVHPGGQAIVGNVNTQGGGGTKAGEQPHAQ